MNIDRASALSAWSLVSSVVPTRTPKPVLRNVRVVTVHGVHHFEATDLEVSVCCPFNAVATDGVADFLLPADRFGAILKSSTDDKLSVNLDGDKVVVQGVRSRFSLPSADAAQYPSVSAWDDDRSFYEVDAQGLRRAIRRTAFATDPDSTRYALGGVLFELSPKRLDLVATDGRRLAKATADEFPGEVGDDSLLAFAVVPLKALRLIDRACADAGKVSIRIDGSAIQVKTDDGVVIRSRLVEGRFPAYKDIVPKTHACRVKADAQRLRSAVEQASITTDEGSRGIGCEFGGGESVHTLTLRSQTPDAGSSSVQVGVEIDGGPVGIGFDSRYLIDVLKAVDDADSPHITIELTDAKSPALVLAKDYLHVLMPLTRD